jgi:AcrR family transcriptional regulator
VNENTDARILDGARELFSRHGPASVTMGEVAARVGTSRKTLYQYYPNKEELLRRVIEATFAEYDGQIKRVLEDHQIGTMEKLPYLMDIMGTQLAWFSRPMVEDLRSRYPDIWKLTEDFRNRKVMGNLERLLEEGRGRGLYRKDVDGRLLALMIFHMSQNIIDPEVLADLPVDAFGAFRSIIMVFMEGVFTDKARARYAHTLRQDLRDLKIVR